MVGSRLLLNGGSIHPRGVSRKYSAVEATAGGQIIADGAEYLYLASLNFPSIASVEKFVEVTSATLGDDIFDLLIHHVFVTRQVVPGTQHADRSWETRAVFHMREEESVGWTRVMRVMNHEVRFRDAVAELDDLNVAVGLAANALIAIRTKHERLAMLKLNDVFTAGIAVRE